MAVKQICIFLLVVLAVKAEIPEEAEELEFLTESRRFCGRPLTNSLKTFCQPEIQELVLGKRFRLCKSFQNANRSISAKATPEEKDRVGRSARGIIDECCKMMCAPIQLIKYCRIPEKEKL